MALSVSKSRSFCQGFQSSVWSRFLSEESKWTLDSVRKYLYSCMDCQYLIISAPPCSFCAVRGARALLDYKGRVW